VPPKTKEEKERERKKCTPKYSQLKPVYTTTSHRHTHMPPNIKVAQTANRKPPTEKRQNKIEREIKPRKYPSPPPSTPQFGHQAERFHPADDTDAEPEESLVGKGVQPDNAKKKPRLHYRSIE